MRDLGCRYLLLTQRGDPGLANEGGATPFMFAAQGGHVDTARLLAAYVTRRVRSNLATMGGQVDFARSSARTHARLVGSLMGALSPCRGVCEIKGKTLRAGQTT